VPGHLLGVGAGNDGQDSARRVEDAEDGLVDLDSDDLAGVGHADLDALVADLDAAAGGHLPLHPRRPGGWGREWSGQASVAEPVALLGRDRGGHGAGQHAVDDQVQQRPVQAEGDPASGVLEPDRDGSSGQGDHTDRVGGAVDLNRQPRRKRAGSSGRWRWSGRAAAGLGP